MNGHKLARGAALAGLVLALGACDQGLTGINDNPNAPTDVGAEYLLPQAIRAAVEQEYQSFMMLSHTSIWPQHTSQVQYLAEEIGQVRPGTMQGWWDGFYAGYLEDTKLVIEKGQDGGKSNIEGVGFVWKAWLYSQLTDLYGDIPYSEALQGADNITPAYDTQQEVYAGMIADLAQGAGLLASGSGDFGNGDILYGNDFTKWRKFANSLRMRLAMRMSEVDPATGRAVFQAAYTAGGFTSNDDNAMLEWPGAPYRNPLFENTSWGGGNRDDHGLSATMVDTLESLGDPRLYLYAEPATEDGAYRGLQNGYNTPPLSIGWYSRIGNFWRRDGASTPTAIMTYSEVLFLQAEAAALGWIGGDAGTFYTQAIQANMDQYDPWSPANGPSDAQIAEYLANPRVVYAGGAAGLDQIHLQKWISLFMGGIETWSEWRRTDVPALKPGPDLVVSRIPIRMSYPEQEQSLNYDNLMSAVSRQGGGLDLVTPLWWDVN
jgi:hypothetical protein